MVPRKRPFLVLAVVSIFLSVTAHVLGMALTSDSDVELEIEGSASPVQTALGNNFQDLVKAGNELAPSDAEVVPATKSSEPVVNKSEAIKPIEMEIESAQTIESPKPIQTIRARPVDSQSISVQTAEIPQPQNVTEQKNNELQTARPVGALEYAHTPRVENAIPIESINQTQSQSLIEKAKQSQVVMITPSNPNEIIRSEEPAPQFPAPQTRPNRPKKASEAPEKSKPKTKTEAPSKKTAKKPSNGKAKSKSKRTAKAGDQSGKAKAKASSTGKKSKASSKKAGNAAIANYPGKVFRKVARTRQKKVGGKGTVRIRFTVNSSGTVSGVSVVGSSGNGKIDSAAMSHVKRAAPFPIPPAGAQRKFVIPIEYRR